MVLKVLLGILIVAAAVLMFAAAKPSQFRIEKSVIVQAPPEKVYALVADFHNWPQWAPQDREDSTMLRTFSGRASGAGSVSDWTSKGSAGAGRMTMTAAAVPSRIDIAVDWKRPFRTQNLHHFRLTPVSGGTQVTWIAEGANLYMMKVIEVFVGVNGLMGKHFETGLANLKSAAES